MKVFLLPVCKTWLFGVVWLFVSTTAFSEASSINNKKMSLENAWNTPVRFHCPATADELSPDKPLRVMVWNVRFMTGGVYNFWDGPDAVEELDTNKQKVIAKQVIALIRDVNPDIVLLQEVDWDPRVGMDQVQWLIDELGEQYPCYSATTYSRLNHDFFLPERKRPAEQNLVTLSRYQLENSRRYELARIPEPYIRHLRYQRAILETQLKTKNGQQLLILNTHLDAFDQGTDTMERQVDQVNELLNRFEAQKKNWIIGGDFNLLPQGQYELLPPEE